MMHIALTIDSKFVRYCAVTIVSILENNDPKDIMLHIVSGHLPKEDILTLSQVAEKYGTSIAFTTSHMKNFKIMKLSGKNNVFPWLSSIDVCWLRYYLLQSHE